MPYRMLDIINLQLILLQLNLKTHFELNFLRVLAEAQKYIHPSEHHLPFDGSTKQTSVSATLESACVLNEIIHNFSPNESCSNSQKNSPC